MRLRKRWHDQDGPGRRPYLRYFMADMDSFQWSPSGASQEEYEPVRPQPEEWIDCRISESQFHAAFDGLRMKRTRRASCGLVEAGAARTLGCVCG